MRVTLVTTWDIPCGIAEHAFYLKEALEAVPPVEGESIWVEVEENLHPHAIANVDRPVPDWVVLNYQAALHSQWTPRDVQAMQVRGSKVAIIYHDTGTPNSAQCQALHAVADLFLVHEPCEDLPGAVYLRQGVPDWVNPWVYNLDARPRHAWSGRRPIVGSVGFPFPWKNYDLLAEASAEAGWALMLCAPNATEAQVARWTALNPHSEIVTTFEHRVQVLAMLSGCDATAFLYANANTGTSAAIRLGVAARKPVLASRPEACRQFRDLWADPVGGRGIQWISNLNVEEVATHLEFAAGHGTGHVVRLAHQDRWSLKGEQIAQLLRGGTL